METNEQLYVHLYNTHKHSIAKIVDNNVVSDKLKVQHSLRSGGTFVVYIVHPMCSDGYIKIVCSLVKLLSLLKMK